jgi:hypothetical protein
MSDSKSHAKQNRTTITIHMPLPPVTHAALAYLAELDAGGSRADVGPVVTRLVRSELASASPGAWKLLSGLADDLVGQTPAERSVELLEVLRARDRASSRETFQRIVAAGAPAEDGHV